MVSDRAGDDCSTAPGATNRRDRRRCVTAARDFYSSTKNLPAPWKPRCRHGSAFRSCWSTAKACTCIIAVLEVSILGCACVLAYSLGNYSKVKKNAEEVRNYIAHRGIKATAGEPGGGKQTASAVDAATSDSHSVTARTPVVQDQ
ncbi:hypothetical protein HPB49_025353 [Dermacentor silvarum]|uniref:Uncharacterized protein n=1 Tax=Dermacentor silvarum TaxID=543639 RepID=A0ACB8C6C6_DERSI|nr:hypothetical protein HPB49_025353 [Dermacentor silvarum]